MEAQIREGQAPALVVQLGASEEIVGEPGAMMFLTGDVSMDAQFGADDVKSGIKRMVGGESVFHVIAIEPARTPAPSASTSWMARSSASATRTSATRARCRSTRSSR